MTVTKRIMRRDRPCKICKRPILIGQAWHTAACAHWDCVKGDASSTRLFSDLFDRVPRDPDRWAYVAQDGRRYTLGRANGGYNIHTVDLKTGKALCGHYPGKTSKRQSSSRAKWLFLKTVPDHYKACIHCADREHTMEKPECSTC